MFRDLENTIKQVSMNKGDKNFTGTSNCRGAHGQQKVNVKQMSSTAAPSQPNPHCLSTDLLNTFKGLSHPMAVVIANMDGKNLLSFLSSHVVEHELLHNEVSSALQISDNSPKLVLDAVESLYYCHQTENETKSCIFLLEQLMALSPDIMLDVKEAARKIAFDWQEKLKAKNRNLLLILMFLLLVSTYRLVSTFHGDELLDLYQRVAEQKPSPELFRALLISKDISNAAWYSEAEAQKATSKSLPVKNVAASSSTVPELDVESLCTKMDSEGKERISVCSEVPTFINRSPDPADLILNALRNCHGSNFLKNKNPQLVLKSFGLLLEQLMSVTQEIRPEVQGRAYLFSLDWKAKSTGPCSWEALAFLQFLATYQLSSVTSSDALFGLLEVVYQPKKASNLIRMFGLVDKIPALLKQHVQYSKLVAKKICNKGQNTPEAQNKAIVSEISALKNVIKVIRQHGLQSEYPPEELQSTIELLEGRRANLKTSMQKVNANVPGPEVQMQNVDTKKRPANDAACISEAPLPPANKIPRVDSRSEFIIYPKSNPNRSEPAMSQHPGDLNVEPYAPSSRALSRKYSSSGSPLIYPPYNYTPPFRVASTQSFHPVWHNPRYPHFNTLGHGEVFP